MAFTDGTPEGFETWLTDHLNRLQLDGEVYAGYIHGTLLTTDDDFTVEEVEKYVLDVVSGFIEEQSQCEAVSKDIACKWCEGRARSKKDAKTTVLNLAAEVDRVLQGSPQLKQASNNGVSGQSEAKPLQTTNKLTHEEKKQLLEQYGCQSSEDDEYGLESYDGGTADGAGGSKAKPSDLDLFINMNAASVLEQQKVQRETAKMAHDAKVEKDKQNRQVQKQKVQDRREKEKKRTQKQERRA